MSFRHFLEHICHYWQRCHSPHQVIMNCQQQSPTPTGFRLQFLKDQFSWAALFLSNRSGDLVGQVYVLQFLALCLNLGQVTSFSFLDCKGRYLYYWVDIVTNNKQLLSYTAIFKENISFHTRTWTWKAFLFVCVQILGGNPGHWSCYTGALPVSSCSALSHLEFDMKLLAP